MQTITDGPWAEKMREKIVNDLGMSLDEWRDDLNAASEALGVRPDVVEMAVMTATWQKEKDGVDGDPVSWRDMSFSVKDTDEGDYIEAALKIGAKDYCMPLLVPRKRAS